MALLCFLFKVEQEQQESEKHSEKLYFISAPLSLPWLIYICFIEDRPWVPDKTSFLPSTDVKITLSFTTELH